MSELAPTLICIERVSSRYSLTRVSLKRNVTPGSHPQHVNAMTGKIYRSIDIIGVGAAECETISHCLSRRLHSRHGAQPFQGLTNDCKMFIIVLSHGKVCVDSILFSH